MSSMNCLIYYKSQNKFTARWPSSNFGFYLQLLELT